MIKRLKTVSGVPRLECEVKGVPVSTRWNIVRETPETQTTKLKWHFVISLKY